MPNNPTTPAQGEETIPCPTCDGQGRVLKNDGHDYPDAAPEMWYKDCPTCGGTGKVPAGLIGDFGIPTPQAGEPCTLLFCCSGKQPAGHNAPTPHQEPDTNTISHPFQAGSGNKCDLCGRSQALHPLQPEPEEWGKHIDKGVTHFKGDDCDPANVEQPSATDPISKQPEIQTDSPALDPLIRDLIEMVARGGAVLDNPGAPGKDRNVIIRVGIIREMERVIAPFLASMKDEAVREAIRRTGEALKARYPLDQRDPYGIREAVNADMDEVVANTLAALPTIDAGDKDND